MILAGENRSTARKTSHSGTLFTSERIRASAMAQLRMKHGPTSSRHERITLPQALKRCQTQIIFRSVSHHCAKTQQTATIQVCLDMAYMCNNCVKLRALLSHRQQNLSERILFPH